MELWIRDTKFNVIRQFVWIIIVLCNVFNAQSRTRFSLIFDSFFQRKRKFEHSFIFFWPFWKFTQCILWIKSIRAAPHVSLVSLTQIYGVCVYKSYINLQVVWKAINRYIWVSAPTVAPKCFESLLFELR